MNNLDLGQGPENSPDGTQKDTTYHGKNHGETGRDKVIHRLLGFLHRDTAAADPTEGDIIVAIGTPPLWTAYAYSPAPTNITRNALIADFGTTVPAWTATLDGTAPTTVSEGATAAAGTSLIYSHRDHTHGAPATWKATAHNLLDGDRHPDTAAGTVARGDLSTGQGATPKWTRLAKPSTPALLYNDATDVAWNTLVWTSIVTASGNFAAFGAGTWTVADADINTFKYLLVGKTMWVNFIITTSTVSRSGGSPIYLAITIPAGKTVNGNHIGFCPYVLDNGVQTTGIIQTTGTQILISRSDNAQWANATDTTYVWGSLVLETT